MRAATLRIKSGVSILVGNNILRRIIGYKINSNGDVVYCIVLYCIEGVVIPAQCTAMFSDLLCSLEFRYY